MSVPQLALGLGTIWFGSLFYLNRTEPKPIGSNELKPKMNRNLKLNQTEPNYFGLVRFGSVLNFGSVRADLVLFGFNFTVSPLIELHT